jgi:hypothetical protein
MILGEEVDEDGEPVELAAEDIVMCKKRGLAIDISSGDYLSNEMRNNNKLQKSSASLNSETCSGTITTGACGTMGEIASL